MVPLAIDPDVLSLVASFGRGALLASADQFEIVIEGRGAHEAMPHQGLDPVPIACEVVTALQALVAAAYGATHLFTDQPEAPEVPTAIPVVSAGDWAYDRAAEVWRSAR